MGKDSAPSDSAKKGYVDFELSYTAKGGHSSRPGENFTTTMIAKALIAIQEDNAVPCDGYDPPPL